MSRWVRPVIAGLIGLFLCVVTMAGIAAGQSASAPAEALAGTAPLVGHTEPAAEMVAGIDRFLMREIERASRERGGLWPHEPSSVEAYLKAVGPHRERLRRIIGAVDPRSAKIDMELLATTTRPAGIETDRGFTAYAVRWPVLEGLDAEGLLLTPQSVPQARVIALPDADWTPEMLAGLASGVPPAAQFARRLAEAGCEVLVPMLLDRSDTFSGNPAVSMTNQPHREFIYRMAYEMGRHVIGYEVQKVLAGVDYFAARKVDGNKPIGVIGYGEGGLIALYSAAIDSRIQATVVSGYFQQRDRLWSEPIYRNVWSLLGEFGDAELARLIAPRSLIVEASRGPIVAGPPPARDGRYGAAPGTLSSPVLEEVRAEVERARPTFESLKVPERLRLIVSGDGQGPPGSTDALSAFLQALDAKVPAEKIAGDGPPPPVSGRHFDPQARLKRQFDQMVEYTQRLVRRAEFRRRDFWAKVDASSPGAWQASCMPYRQYLWEEVIGRLPDPSVPASPRTRLAYDKPTWKGYEVMLDVWPDVLAYGILLVPKDLKLGERRPVVVCQHGLEGFPQKVIDLELAPTYAMFGTHLVERGFIVYAPQNPYAGGDRFRVLQRKANPLKLSLYSFIAGQHARTLEWLGGLPFVDAKRIGYYGLSYGGRTAMMVPPLLDRHYALAICSGNFNEWIWKTTSVSYTGSYMFTNEYEMPDFDVGGTFNHAELAGLIAPRPFMVERGHSDGVGLDEWVAYEYAKVGRLYAQLHIADRTAIEYFDGGHQIHGEGTFAFLHKYLDWPEPRK